MTLTAAADQGLIFTNELFLGPVLLRLFEGSPIRLFALHSTLTDEQQALIGGSRERCLLYTSRCV